MDKAFSITYLSEYLSQRDFGPSMELTLLQTEECGQSITWKGHELPWNGLSCLSIVCYVLKFCSVSENSDVFDIICRLNDLATEYYNAKPRVVSDNDNDALMRLKDVVSKYETVGPPEGEDFQAVLPIILLEIINYDDADDHGDFVVDDLDSDYERTLYRHIRERNLQNVGKRQEIAETFVNDFFPKVQQFFNVPKRNGHLAGFINFLLQILNFESKHIRYEGHGSRILWGIQNYSKEWLQMRLNFILAVLGDVPFQFTEMEQVKTILIEFEVVANEAGSFIYSYFFRPCHVNACQYLEEFLVLSRKVDLLKVKMEEVCIEFSKLPLRNYATPINAADSLFIVESLLEDLQNFITSRDDLITDTMKYQTTKLHEQLLSAQSFLQDANLIEEKDIQELKIQIRDAAYEAEYLLNSFLARDFPSSYFSLRLPMVIKKFELLTKGFAEIMSISSFEVLRVNETVAEVPSQKMVLTPDVGDDNVLVGLEDEVMEILDELTGGSEDLTFICIYGMPGIGKTMLAKRLYNDRLIIDRFDECAWCVASQAYQKRNVLIEILMSLRSMLDKGKILEMEDEDLISEIYKILFCRRYLIVIDDIWDSDVWNDLRKYFRNDRNGSRILFTTRIRDTAPTNNILLHTPHFLSKDQCWKLLEKKVFLDEPCPSQLRDSGKRIAEKCNGLPLAVVVIAGTLANMGRETCEWEKVEKSLDTYASNCMNILELSYKHLPNHLKQCFLYLGVFPHDSEIPVRKLIQLWIVEGFIPKNLDKSQEQVAEEYFNNLVNRSLVLVARNRSTGGVKACRIHDLLHDLCLRIAEEENFLNLIQTEQSSMHEKHLRLCVLSTAPTHLRPFSLNCRSFFGNLSDSSSTLPQMKRIKVMELALHGGLSRINILKTTNLFHLRYLVIDQTIPESILHNLVNLEVLCVNSTSDVNVSTIILKMVKLRHLHVKYAKFLTKYNSSQPNNLQSLSNIQIWNTENYENLRSSPRLRKLKCLCGPLLLDLCFLTELQSLKIGVTWLLNEIPRYNHTINFPLTIKKLSLTDTQLPSEMMSVLGRLPELLALKLITVAFEGKEWMTSDNEFQKLRFLKLCDVDLEQWTATSEHFPKLCHLVLFACTKLQNFPTELGDILTLHTIEVHECSIGASISAVQVEHEQRDNGNEGLQVFTTNRSWSKEHLVFKYNEVS